MQSVNAAELPRSPAPCFSRHRTPLVSTGQRVLYVVIYVSILPRAGLMFRPSAMGQPSHTRDSRGSTTTGNVKMKITCPECNQSHVDGWYDILKWRTDHQCRTNRNPNSIRFSIQPIREGHGRGGGTGVMSRCQCHCYLRRLGKKSKECCGGAAVN